MARLFFGLLVVGRFVRFDIQIRQTAFGIDVECIGIGVFIGSAVAFGDYDGYVHFLSSSDGRLLGRIQVGGGAVVSPLVSTPRGVLVQTGNGSLVLVGVN